MLLSESVRCVSPAGVIVWQVVYDLANTKYPGILTFADQRRATTGMTDVSRIIFDMIQVCTEVMGSVFSASCSLGQLHSGEGCIVSRVSPQNHPILTSTRRT